MTQPVQEPTQGRTNQGLEWRTRQLFRRPSLDGGQQIARLQQDAGQTINTGASVYVTYDMFDRTDDTFETGTTPASRDNASGDDIVFVNKVGYYRIDSQVRYSTTSGFGAVAKLEGDQNFGSFFLGGTNNHRDNNPIDVQAGPGGRDWLTDYAIYYHAGDTGSGWFALRTFHDSGSNQTIIAEVVVYYMGLMSPLRTVY